MRLVIDISGFLTEVESEHIEKCLISNEELIGDFYFIRACHENSGHSTFYFSVHKNFWEPFKREKRINQLIHPLSNHE